MTPYLAQIVTLQGIYARKTIYILLHYIMTTFLLFILSKIISPSAVHDDHHKFSRANFINAMKGDLKERDGG